MIRNKKLRDNDSWKVEGNGESSLEMVFQPPRKCSYNSRQRRPAWAVRTSDTKLLEDSQITWKHSLPGFLLSIPIQPYSSIYLSLHKHAMLQNVVNKVEMKKVASEQWTTRNGMPLAKPWHMHPERFCGELSPRCHWDHERLKCSGLGCDDKSTGRILEQNQSRNIRIWTKCVPKWHICPHFARLPTRSAQRDTNLLVASGARNRETNLSASCQDQKE